MFRHASDIIRRCAEARIAGAGVQTCGRLRYSFENTGQLIVSRVADAVSLKRMGIDHDAQVTVGAFSQGQRRYLEFHRENVLRMARGLSIGEHSG